MVSFIGVPIRADTKVVGTLTIDRIWDGGAEFRLDEDVRFLVMIANLVGQTVRLYKSSTTPKDPARGILDAVALAASDLDRSVEELLGDGEVFARADVEKWMDWQAADLNAVWRPAFMALVRRTWPKPGRL